MNTKDLKDIFASSRPLIEQSLDIAEQIAALRDAATEKGLDWSQLKALLKAQIQDERDGKHRVGRIIEKADFACSYAELLGLNSKMNENNISAAA
jgi:hypothetical protein